MNGALIPHGPALAAIIILGITAGRTGLRELWRRVTNFRAGWWFLIGPAIILLYQGLAFLANLLLGATLVAPLALPAMGTVVQLLLFGGQWEEIGWSGYALPKLLERFGARPNGPLIAALVLGVFRAIWHSPLFLAGKLYWFDIFIFEFALQTIIAWLFIRSGGSVPAVMLFHFLSNLAGAITSAAFAGPERTTYSALFMGMAGVIALVIAWMSRSRMGYKGEIPAAASV
jgi:hypothetical protein